MCVRTCIVPSLTLDPLCQEVPDFDGEGVWRIKAVDGLVRQTLDHVRHVHPLSHDGGLHTTQTPHNISCFVCVVIFGNKTISLAKFAVAKFTVGRKKNALKTLDLSSYLK